MNNDKKFYLILSLIILLILGFGGWAFWQYGQQTHEEVIIPTITTTINQTITVYDDIKLLAMNLPQNWEDVDGSAIFSEDGLLVGSSLTASPSLATYLTHLNAPGVSISISQFHVSDEIVNKEEIISNRLTMMFDERSKDITEHCLYFGTTDIKNQDFIGYYGTYSNCSSSNNDLTFYFTVLKSTHLDYQTVATIEFRATTEDEKTIFTDLLKSFSQLKPLSVETQALPDYAPYWNDPEYPFQTYLTKEDNLGILSLDLPEEFQDYQSQLWKTSDNLVIGNLLFISPNLDRYIDEQGSGMTIGIGVADYTSLDVIIKRRNYYQSEYKCGAANYYRESTEENSFWVYDVNNCKESSINYLIIGVSPNNAETPYFGLIEFSYSNQRDLDLLPTLFESWTVNEELLFNQDFIRFPDLYE